MKKKIYLGGRMSGKSFFDDEEELTPLEALQYLDDIAHGRKMAYDPHELKCIIEKSLKRLESLETEDDLFIFYLGGREAGKTAITMSICNKLKALEVIKKELNIDEILFSLKGVASAKDYDLVKEVLCSENY